MALFGLSHEGRHWKFQEVNTGITIEGGFDEVRQKAHEAFKRHPVNARKVDLLFAKAAREAELKDLKPPTKV